jgi:pimeloyl-ACP methyl ester carboxylesterase
MQNKVLLIHGLNNTLESFRPLQQKLNSLNFDCILIGLPGHGENRHECPTLELALKKFDELLQPHIKCNYNVIAFSQGALYFQLWLNEHGDNRPHKQVLLAPALSIRFFGIAEKIISALPRMSFIPSQTPKKFRKYPFLFGWEYKILFEAATEFIALKSKAPIPTLVLLDPKDEVIDSISLKKEMDKENIPLIYFSRPYLKGKRPGKHHILFHPDYFSQGDWEKMIKTIENFFKI